MLGSGNLPAIQIILVRLVDLSFLTTHKYQPYAQVGMMEISRIKMKLFNFLTQIPVVYHYEYLDYLGEGRYLV